MIDERHPELGEQLDTCVTCGLCLPVCPTFRLTGDEAASPRGRIAAVAAVAAGDAVVDARFDEITSFCLQCRACETACPSAVPFGSIIETARAEAAPVRPRRFRRIAVTKGVRWTRAIRLAKRLSPVLARFVGPLRDMRSGTRPSTAMRGGSWAVAAESTREVVLFTGCVADHWFPGLHQATVAVLNAAGFSVIAPAEQTCCGALASHSGYEQGASELASQNIEALSGDNLIAVDVAGCGAHLKGYGAYGSEGARMASRVRDINELVAEAIEDGRLPSFDDRSEMVAMIDPCHLEHGQRIVEEPRAILRAAGYRAVDADRDGLCCGAAGIYQLDHPATGEALGERKAAAVRQTGAALVAAANVGCEMQLRRFLDDAAVVRHPIEYYAEALASATV